LAAAVIGCAQLAGWLALGALATGLRWPAGLARAAGIEPGLHASAPAPWL